MCAEGATANGSTTDVLVYLNSIHQLSGKTSNGRNNVLVWTCCGCTERLRCPGANRNNQQIVFTLFPVQVVSGFGRHAIEQESWVVIWRYRTIHEYEGFGLVGWIPLQNLRRKKYWRRSAGSNQLPEGNPKIAILSLRVVILRIGVTAHRPRRIGSHVLSNRQQEAFEVVRVKGCVAA